MEQERSFENITSMKKTNLNSETMFQNLVEKALDDLFDYLDSDHDGLISALRVKIDGLPNPRLKIIAPLLAEMEDKRVSLDILNFKIASHRLMNVLNVEEKRILLGLDNKRKPCIEDMINIPFKV